MPESHTPPGSGPSLASAPPPESPDTSSSVEASPTGKVHSRLAIWLHRLLVLLFVFVCAAAGVLLVVMPWTPQWTDNSLLVRYPDLRIVMTHGFFRGLCSGLGLLDIWIGFSEAIHYHEDKLP